MLKALIPPLIEDVEDESEDESASASALASLYSVYSRRPYSRKSLRSFSTSSALT